MEKGKDELKGKFTAWMKVVVKRAKIDYIRRLIRHSNEISIEDEELTDKLIYEPVNDDQDAEGFCFDNSRLSDVFRKLPKKRRQVLELLYVHSLEPDEVAEEMKCSLQHVYNLRSLAIKELKSKMSMGDDDK